MTTKLKCRDFQRSTLGGQFYKSDLELLVIFVSLIVSNYVGFVERNR